MKGRDYTSESTRKHSPEVRYIICSKCGLSGGTLVKVDDRYECQDKEKCRIMQLKKQILKGATRKEIIHIPKEVINANT